ncbi:MAG: NAD(P)/FAD-dependent oxidoreductase [Burkholderiales bacterium]|nr:NAD(P)/FAD-dependent oxidoreductase [Burkholderiales bacterium]
MNFDVVIVGAGFAGMYMLHRARRLGFSAQVLEAGSGVGGTWYWNRYPGARCDIESLEYSYGFDDALQQEWRWSERYAAQPEILRYADHVADRFGLRPHMRFDTRVVAASFDESTARWAVRTDDGAEIRGRFLIMATGCLSRPNKPRIAGLDAFRGGVYHTGEWPHETVDFSGQRVGVIGTGSSAVQSIPIIAEQAQALTVFQRTATYSVPARNAPLDPAYEAQVKREYATFRARNRQMPNAFGSNLRWSQAPALEAPPEARRREFEQRWHEGGLYFLRAFGDLILDPRANETAAQFVRDKIREIVRDPAVAELLSPRQVIGAKRLCIDTGYYETFNRPNVRLVDVSETPIDAVTPQGLRVGAREYALDAIVFATGFDAMTGALLGIDIRGRAGVNLRDAWREGPRNYLGLSIAGFPNLFTITGPGSPSVLTNMLVSIEQHVDWIADCLAYLRDHAHVTIEARRDAQDAWVAHVNATAERTVYPLANSWYIGANVAGKPRVFMPLIGFPPYVEKCNAVAAERYAGFALG